MTYTFLKIFLSLHTCTNTAAREWLQKHRPKLVLHPSTAIHACKYLKEQLSRNQALYNRMQQLGSGDESNRVSKGRPRRRVQRIQNTATKAREFYRASTERCKQQWERIMQSTENPGVRTSWRVQNIAIPISLAPTTNSLSAYHHGDKQSNQIQRTISKRSLITSLG